MGPGLTEHGLQPDQAGDEVVKVDGEVFLRVAQDDQLEQVIGQLDSWKGGGPKQSTINSLAVTPLPRG